MSYQVLARKWRPHGFTEMVGQGHVLRALTNALDSDRLHHAYLFTGTRGVGKTSLARVFAKALNCENGVSSSPCGQCSSCIEVDEGRCVDLIEVDAASRTKVDETRDLLDNVQYAPTRGRYKVYLIDEVHMFSTHSFNALLKTLEEPPPHVKFLLATTDPKKLPVTVLSRCLQFNLKRISVEQLRTHLRMIVEQENVTADDESLVLLAHAADGSVRDSLSLLDQAIAYCGGELTQPEVATMLGTIGSAEVAAMVEFLSADDGAGLITLARDLAQSAPDYHHVLGELLSLLRRIAVYKALGEEASALDESEDVVNLSAELSAEECQLFYQIGLIGRRDLGLAPEPQVGFEMVLLRMLAFRPAGAEDDIAPRRRRPHAPRQKPEAGGSQSGALGSEKEMSAVAPEPTRTAASSSMLESSAKVDVPGAAVPDLSLGAHAVAKAGVEAAPPESGNPAPTLESNLNGDGALRSVRELSAIEHSPAAQSQFDNNSLPSVQHEPAHANVDTAKDFDWNDIVSRLTLDGLVRELARNAAFRAYDGRVVELLLAPQHENLRADRLVQALETVLKNQLGHDIRVRLAIDGGRTLDTPSKRMSEAEMERQQEAVHNIDADPTVKSLRDQFGATVERVAPQ